MQKAVEAGGALTPRSCYLALAAATALAPTEPCHLRCLRDR